MDKEKVYKGNCRATAGDDGWKWPDTNRAAACNGMRFRAHIGWIGTSIAHPLISDHCDCENCLIYEIGPAGAATTCQIGHSVRCAERLSVVNIR
jgi:hypothetical protein